MLTGSGIFLHTGYALDPEYREHQVSNNKEVMGDLHTMIQRILPNPKSQHEAIIQFSAFKNGRGSWGELLSVSSYSANKVAAHTWWEMYGYAAPRLQEVATKVLSQPSSIGSAERNWSSYDFIHNKKRNRLGAKTAEKLVYCHSNLRLKEKLNDIEWEEQFCEWGYMFGGVEEGEDSDSSRQDAEDEVLAEGSPQYSGSQPGEHWVGEEDQMEIFGSPWRPLERKSREFEANFLMNEGLEEGAEEDKVSTSSWAHSSHGTDSGKSFSRKRSRQSMPEN